MRAAACVAPKELASELLPAAAATAAAATAAATTAATTAAATTTAAAIAPAAAAAAAVGGPGLAREGGVPLSFWQLHARLHHLQPCILLGWRRGDALGEDGTPKVVLNPNPNPP